MKNIPFSPPDISQAEIDEVVDALSSGWITTGPKTKEFERQIAAYCGTSTAVCLNSATACLALTLRLLGIGPGDEVIISAYTYTASASPIAHVGAKIVLVDTAKDSFEMDYDALADAITEKTKAVIPVDVGIILCDYDRVFAAVEEKKPCSYLPTRSRHSWAGWPSWPTVPTASVPGEGYSAPAASRISPRSLSTPSRT